MNVDEWFSALNREERKLVLDALHGCRQQLTGPSGGAPWMLFRWEQLKPLLRALEEDHEDLKCEPSSYRLKFCELCSFSAPQQCVAPKVSSL